MIVKHRRGTTKEWRENDIIIEAGEIVIEECDDGTRRAKIGTGYQYFSDLPYIDAKLWEEIDDTKINLNNKIDKLDSSFSDKLSEAKKAFEEQLAFETSVRAQAIADLNQIALQSDKQLRYDFQDADSDLSDKIDAAYGELQLLIDENSSAATIGINELSDKVDRFDENLSSKLSDHTDKFDKKLATAKEYIVNDYTTKITPLAADVQEASVKLAELSAQTDDNRKVIADYARDTNNKISATKTSLKNQIAAQAKRIDNLIVPSGDTPVTNEDLRRELEDIRIGYDNSYYTSAGEAVRAIDSKLDELEESLSARTVNGLHYEDNILHLTLNGEYVGEGVEIVGGSGGGGDTYIARLYTSMATSLTVAKADTIELTAAFYEKFGSESTKLPGVLSVSYKLPSESSWTVHSTSAVNQNEEFSVDIAPILNMYNLGTKVEIKFMVIAGESKKECSLTFTISQIEAYIEPINFNNEQLFTKDFKFYYKCIGKDLKKTVYFDIDEEPCISIDVGTSNKVTLDANIPITNYNYGAHYLTVYYKTPEGAISNKKQFILLYNDGTSKEPMIGASCIQPEITYGDTLTGKFMVSTPGSETTTSVHIQLLAYDENGIPSVYFEREEQNIINNKLIPWEITKYPMEGDALISFTSDANTKVIPVRIKKSDSAYDLNPVKSGLIYEYFAAGKTNSTIGKESYEYSYIDTETKQVATIDTSFDKFNWVSNGYPTVDGEDTALVLSGPARHIIKLPMFSSTYKDKNEREFNLGYVNSTGRTFEIEFKVSNVTDQTAPIITCMPTSNDGAFIAPGFVITPQVCYLLQRGATIQTDKTGFIENEDKIAAAYIKDNSRVRVAFVIEKQHKGYTYNGENYPGQCINIYVNGQYANSLPYPDGADFSQEQCITIGSDTCITKLYEVRIYNTGLSAADILQNYMVSPQAVSDKISRCDANNVLDDQGNIDYDKAIKKYPCLLLTGELSTYTGTNDGGVEAGKAASGVTLTKPDPTKALGYKFELKLLDNDNGKWLSSNKIQGTTSKKYPIRNYKIYLAEADGTDETGKLKSKKVKYYLKGKDLSIGESTLCWKCDYMSTDHANTFNANLADTLFDDDTLAKQENPLVQNTIYGFRCLLFQRDTETSPIKFIGDGSLNNDKSNAATFGLKCEGDEGNHTTRQKWEIRNNTELISMFMSDRLLEPADNKGKNKAYAALESTYPDQGDLEEAGLTPNYSHIQTLYTWVCQRANFWDASDTRLDVPKQYTSKVYDPETGAFVSKTNNYFTERDYRKAIFINEFTTHFNKDHALIYYLFCEFIALSDNRAKNMFLRSENVTDETLFNINNEEIKITDIINKDTGEVNADEINWEKSTFATWITDLYDLDSCYGVENAGKLEVPYYADWRYELDDTKKFNGYESRLWLMFEEAFAEDIKFKAQELTNSSLNYETVYKSHIEENTLNTCPAIVNRDMEFKYHNTWIDGFTDYSQTPPVFGHFSLYKYLQRGSRTEQKDSFISKRFNMLYSKYLCDKCTSNQINFRCGASLAEEANAITLKANQVFYPAVGFGDAEFTTGDRTNPNTAVTLAGRSMNDGQDYIYIGGASYLTDIGDISKFLPYNLNLAAATSLKCLILGSDTTINNKLTELNLSTCPLLEELNIVGCTGLSNSVVDLSANKLLRKVSTSTPVKLPDGGILGELNLKDPKRIEVLNQNNLSIFTCTADGKNVFDTDPTKRGQLHGLYRLWVENTLAIPALALASEYIDQLTGGLRLAGVNEILTKEQLLRLASDTALNKYINPSGDRSNDQQYPHISGTCTVTNTGDSALTGEEYNKITSTYPTLKVNYAELHTNVTFKYQNDAGEAQEKVIKLTLNNSQSDDLTNHEGIPDAYWPTDDAFTYTFKGWSEEEQPNNSVNNTEDDWKNYFQEDALKNIVGDRVLYPVFEAVRRSYTVILKYGESIDEVYECPCPYGSVPDLSKIENYKEPTKTDYKFTGWHTDSGAVLGEITGDTICYAQFSPNDKDEDGYPGYTLTLNDIEYSCSNDSLSVTKCKNCFNAAIKVPKTFMLDGADYIVKSVAGFNAYDSLEYICLPDELESLGANAFQECKKLVEISWPKSSTTIVIDEFTFNYCTKLKQIPFDLLRGGNERTIIPSNAFSHCEALQKITVPEGITKLDNTCFAWCYDVSEISLPSGLKTIMTFVFNSCRRLENVDIPASVATIEANSFGKIPTLKQVNFNKSDGSTKIPHIHWTAFESSGLADTNATSVQPSGCVSFIVPWTLEQHLSKKRNNSFIGTYEVPGGMDEAGNPVYETRNKDIFFGACIGSTITFADGVKIKKVNEVEDGENVTYVTEEAN